MLAITARAVPANLVASSVPSCTEIISCWPSCATFTDAWASKDNAPFGPLMETFWPARDTCTPAGRFTGELATRDIAVSSGDVAEHFATVARGARSSVAHDPLRGGDDRHAEAALDL